MCIQTIILLSVYRVKINTENTVVYIVPHVFVHCGSIDVDFCDSNRYAILTYIIYKCVCV